VGDGLSGLSSCLGLSGCQVIGLSGFRGYRVVGLSGVVGVIELSGVVRFSGYRVIRLSGVVGFSGYRVVGAS